MLSAGDIIMNYVCPSLGLIIANAMYLAPSRDIQKSITQGSLGDLNPFPWAFIFGNTMGQVIYGIIINVSHSNNFFVFVRNLHFP